MAEDQSYARDLMFQFARAPKSAPGPFQPFVRCSKNGSDWG